MKKIIQFLTGTAVSVGLMAGVASAQAAINTTGPGSTNVITFTTTENIVVSCTNNTNVTNNNNQNSTSGSANTSGNTVGGSATSGAASNNSNTSVNVNGGCPGGFTPVASTTPAPAAGNAAGNGAGGSGAVNGASTTATGVAALPATGSDSVLTPVAIGASVLGVTAVAAQVALSLYRRLALK